MSVSGCSVLVLARSPSACRLQPAARGPVAAGSPHPGNVARPCVLPAPARIVPCAVCCVILCVRCAKYYWFPSLVLVLVASFMFHHRYRYRSTITMYIDIMIYQKIM